MPDREPLARVVHHADSSDVYIGSLHVEECRERIGETHNPAWTHEHAAKNLAYQINAAYFTSLDREVKKVVAGFKSDLRAIHGPTAACAYQECSVCAFIDCPFNDALHYHHDGCPAEYVTDQEEIKRAVEAEKERNAKIVEAAWDRVNPDSLIFQRKNILSAIRSAPGQEKGK